MLYNSKWSKFFQACGQLALKNESKDAPPFWTFFHKNVTLWSAAARFFVGAKKGFLSIQMLISCNLCSGNFWNFFHIFSNQNTRRSYDYMCPKILKRKKIFTCTKSGSFGEFLQKTCLCPLGVKDHNVLQIFKSVKMYCKMKIRIIIEWYVSN